MNNWGIAIAASIAIIISPTMITPAIKAAFHVPPVTAPAETKRMASLPLDACTD